MHTYNVPLSKSEDLGPSSFNAKLLKLISILKISQITERKITLLNSLYEASITLILKPNKHTTKIDMVYIIISDKHKYKYSQ
jgi:hypothetical protein